MYCQASIVFVSFVCANLKISSVKADTLDLSRIDDLIYDKLSNPVSGEGDPILDTLHIYNKELNNTIQYYMNNGTGKNFVDMLIETNGPKCIKLYINDFKLEATYKWGVKELGEMYFMLGNIKMLWRDFRYYLTTKLGYDIEPLPAFFTTTIDSSTILS